MSFTRSGFIRVCSGAACAVIALVLVAAPAAAAAISIEFTGMDLVYDGSAIYDAGSTAGGTADPAEADPLSTVEFSVDDTLVGTLTNNVYLDVYLPGITGIPAAAGTVHNLIAPAGGHFDLLVGTSPTAAEYLVVDLDEVSVTYVDVANVVQFTFGAAISNLFAQNLPFGLVLGEPITVSFSAQVVPGTRTVENDLITGFRAAGTGQYNGPLVPEPATCMLAGLGLLALALRRK